MPAEFLKCVKQGGKVRTVSGPSKNPKLKTDEYVRVCIASDGGRYWGEVRRKTKKDLDVEKMKLKDSRSTGIDYDIKYPKARRLELLANLRYLGSSAYPKLKKDEQWGEWTLEEVLKYFAKTVDALRSVNLKYIAERPKDQADTSLWKCYWEAKEYMKSKASKFVKAITPSDIPHLLRPGGIPIFMPGMESWYEYNRRKKNLNDSFSSIELDDLKQKASEAVKSLGSLVVIPDYVSLSGTTTQKSDYELHDINVIIKSKFPDLATQKKVESQFNPEVREMLHFVYQPEGSKQSYVPLYDLTLSLQKFLKLVRIEKDDTTKKDIELENIDSSSFESLIDSEIYKVHLKLHDLWKNPKMKREAIVDAHILVTEEYKNREIIHRKINDLDVVSSKLEIELKEQNNN